MFCKIQRQFFKYYLRDISPDLISLGNVVIRLQWCVQSTESSKTCVKNSSDASCKPSRADCWNFKFCITRSWAISLTRRWNAAFGMHLKWFFLFTSWNNYLFLFIIIVGNKRLTFHSFAIVAHFEFFGSNQPNQEGDPCEFSCVLPKWRFRFFPSFLVWLAFFLTFSISCRRNC